MILIRLLPVISSLLGGIGLGLALGYLVLIVRAFQPGGEPIVAFLIGATDEKLSFGFLVFLIPYAALMAHLWLRVRVGDLLVDGGFVERAEIYAAARIQPSLMRAKKEALANRAVLMRIAIRSGDYERVNELAQNSESLVDGKDPFGMSVARWALEGALRREDLVTANRWIEAIGVPSGTSLQVANFCAAAAEVRVREGKRGEADEWLQRAEFAESEFPRLAFVQACSVARFGGTQAAATEALEQLDRATPWLADVPGAGGEVRAVRAQLVEQAEGREHALGSLGQEPETDSRSRFVWKAVRDGLNAPFAADEEE